MKDESSDSTGADQARVERVPVDNRSERVAGALVPVASVRAKNLLDIPMGFDLKTISSLGQLAISDSTPPAWPSVFPVNCPPLESTDCNGPVIRVLYEAVPTPADFASWMEDNHPDLKKLCQSCGLSVHLHIDHLLAAAKRIPSLRGRYYASLHLVASDGKLMNTPSRNSPEHHTWWKSLTCTTPEERCNVLGFVPT